MQMQQLITDPNEPPIAVDVIESPAGDGWCVRLASANGAETCSPVYPTREIAEGVAALVRQPREDTDE